MIINVAVAVTPNSAGICEVADEINRGELRRALRGVFEDLKQDIRSFNWGDFLLKKGAELPIQGKTAITERDVGLWRGKILIGDPPMGQKI